MGPARKSYALSERARAAHPLIFDGDAEYDSLFEAISAIELVSTVRRLAARRALSQLLLDRAIGVVCKPETERISHYFEARVSERFDAVIHIDRTRALIPLETNIPWHQGEEGLETCPDAV